MARSSIDTPARRRSALGRAPPIRVPAAGAMRLTLMSCVPPAVERLRASPITPPLADAYERFFGSPKMPVDVVMTTRPMPPRPRHHLHRVYHMSQEAESLFVQPFGDQRGTLNRNRQD